MSFTERITHCVILTLFIYLFFKKFLSAPLSHHITSGYQVKRVTTMQCFADTLWMLAFLWMLL